MRRARSLSRGERVDWLRLSQTPRVGPVTFFQLLHQCGSAGAALEALPDLARKGGGRAPAIPAKAAAERLLDRCATQDIRVLAAWEPDYPAPLAAIDDPPPLLFLRGHGHLLARSAVAMVGARNASLNGRRLAQNLAAELGRSGLSVVSGLAAGIDTAAHRGALETGTVAVLAGGPDHVYPSENADLHARIAEIGALVSERPPGFRPQARDFPRRNRIISGLSLGVAVIEAALKSGSLITARLAGEQGREVMAVPGAPADPRARGCNNLIRQGAALVETADDVLQALAPLTPEQFAEPVREEIDPAAGRLTRPARPERLDTESARATLLESLSTAPVQLDELIRNCQLSPQLVLVALLELELAGRVNRHPGGRVSRNFDGDQDALALG